MEQIEEANKQLEKIKKFQQTTMELQKDFNFNKAQKLEGSKASTHLKDYQQEKGNPKERIDEGKIK